MFLFYIFIFQILRFAQDDNGALRMMAKCHHVTTGLGEVVDCCRSLVNLVAEY